MGFDWTGVVLYPTVVVIAAFAFWLALVVPYRKLEEERERAAGDLGFSFRRRDSSLWKEEFSRLPVFQRARFARVFTNVMRGEYKGAELVFTDFSYPLLGAKGYQQRTLSLAIIRLRGLSLSGLAHHDGEGADRRTIEAGGGWAVYYRGESGRWGESVVGTRSEEFTAFLAEAMAAVQAAAVRTG